MRQPRVSEELRGLFVGSTPIQWAKTAEGPTFRERDGRRTFQFLHAGRSYFAKLHSGVALREALKELASLRLPVTGADREARALRALERASVRAPRLVAFDSKGLSPLSRESLVIVEDVGTQRTLEDVGQGLGSGDWLERRRWVVSAANVLRRLHATGVNHRDFYPGHLLAPRIEGEPHALVPIDFHRAGTRRRVPERWVRKDLGALAFGAQPLRLSRTDRLRFVAAYAKEGRAKDELRRNPRRWSQVLRRVARLRAEQLRKGDAFGG